MVKYFLAFFGFQVAGFFGALLGFFIGSGIDRSVRLGMGAVNPFTAAQRQTSFLKTTFTLMGKLAKADGHISQEEVNQVEHFISQMGMTSEHREQAIAYFKEGSGLDDNLGSVLDEFKQHCGNTLNLKQMLLSYLIAIALADGVLHPAEEAILQKVAMDLGFSQQEFARLLSMIGAQNSFSTESHSESDIEQAYKALGVESSDSSQQIKRAYRQLISKYHPDKLMGQGMPEDMIKEATERSQEIRAAYEMIVESRK
jgi:DnaJ like chaperone protein